MGCVSGVCVGGGGGGGGGLLKLMKLLAPLPLTPSPCLMGEHGGSNQRVSFTVSGDIEFWKQWSHIIARYALHTDSSSVTHYSVTSEWH